MAKYDLTIPFPWKIIVSGYKQRRCGRWFLFDRNEDGILYLILELNLVI